LPDPEEGIAFESQKPEGKRFSEYFANNEGRKWFLMKILRK
jgi:hypothetical protein